MDNGGPNAVPSGVREGGDILSETLPPAPPPARRWADILLVPGFALAGAIIAGAAAGLLVAAGALLRGLSGDEILFLIETWRSSNAFLYAVQIAFYLACVAAAAFVLRWRGYRMRRVYFRSLPPLFLGASLATGAIFSVLVMGLLLALPPETQQQLMEQNDLLIPKGMGEAATLFVIAVVLAPVAEEIYFRGIVLGVLGRSMPFSVAAALSAAFFSLSHGHLFNAPGAGGWVLTGVIFVLGVVLAIAARWAGSLRASIAVHASYNLCLFVPSVVSLLPG
ncbi:MAG: CPBP family intramembrane metalloprotease [Parvibaculum sp.]|nr:CPBP family intramembrane metalloprotease [Parvibaculum sp.]